jgi:hypothetical protein
MCAQVLRGWLREVAVACRRQRDELLSAVLELLLAAPPALLPPQARYYCCAACSGPHICRCCHSAVLWARHVLAHFCSSAAS